MPLVFLLLISLLYEPHYWRYYPTMSEIGSITFSNRSVFVGVPDGIYILDRERLQHQRTLTAADGIDEKIRFCAFNQAQNELLIVTATKLYQFLPNSGQVFELHPPFKETRSIGITRAGAFIKTETGIYQKLGGDRYQPAQFVPEPVTWFGENDTTPIRNWTFLTPFFILDEQMKPRPLVRAYPDQKNSRLFVTSPGYGVLIYNLTTGFKETEIRLGAPSEPVKRIFKLGGKLCFLTRNENLFIDSSGTWRSYSIPPGEFSFKDGHLLLRTEIVDLNRRQAISAILPLPSATLLGTEMALYSFGQDGKLTLITEISKPVNALAVFRDSTLVATDDGLFLLINDTLTPVVDPFARFDWGVYSIAQTNNTTFFGTLGGVLKLDENNTWTRLIPPGLDLSQPVRSIAAARNLLFIASNDGVDVYNIKDNSWTKIDRTNGLPFSEINALYADSLYLYIAAPGMIARYEYHHQLR
ncbi:MAG: hypothetical protein ABIK47_05605 [candidate division WOR-3 bacterium]